MTIITKNPTWTSLIKPQYDERVYAMTIGSNVHHWRKYRGFSQQDLSKKTGLTQASISDIENGDGNPTIDTLSKLATALDVKIDMVTKNRIVRKMIEAVEYMLQKINDIDILKAMKLLYFTDLESYQTQGNKLIGLQYMRRNRGPFSQDIYQLDDVFPKKNKTYQPGNFKAYVSLTASDKSFLDQIIVHYGTYKATDLMNKSYQTPPMQSYKKGDQKGMGVIVL